MTPIERAIRRALNPMSTRVTELVQGRGPIRARWRHVVSHGYLVSHGTVGGMVVPTAGTAGHAAGRPGAFAVAVSGPVVVPRVVGMTPQDAVATLAGRGLVAVPAGPDAPPLTAWDEGSGVVTRQHPEPGAVTRGSRAVRLWVEPGPDGGSGVREPRRPRPAPRAGAADLERE